MNSDPSTDPKSSLSNLPHEEIPLIVTDEEGQKSIYHQPSLSRSSTSQRQQRTHRNSGPSREPVDLIAETLPLTESNDNDPSKSRIQFLLGEEEQLDNDDDEHKTHSLFIELSEFVSEEEKRNSSNELREHGWKETARWVKFEENVETGGRWSKPHVATLSLHSLLELRNFILNGTILFDLKADQFPNIIDLILDDLIAKGSLSEEKRFAVRNCLLLKHVHQHEKEFQRQLHAQDMKKTLSFTRSFAELARNLSHKDVTAAAAADPAGANRSTNPNPIFTLKPNDTSTEKFLAVSNKDLQKLRQTSNEDSGTSLNTNESRAKLNMAFMRKIPRNAEATNVLIGAVDFLEAPVYAFVRLNKGVFIPDLVEVPLPIRFLFVLLGPCHEHLRYHEIGRSIATIMADEIFHDVVYRAHHRQDLLSGIDDFLDNVTVLPPGEWDPNTRIEPPKSVPDVKDRLDRLERSKANGMPPIKEDEPVQHEIDPGLVATGRFCGGLIDDIRRKVPFYWSDFKDVVSFQSVAAVIFMYFACLAPIITFGGLLSKATDYNMAAIESLLSGAICGCLYHLFAGQPLTILGSTGPVLVFETIVFHFCSNHGLDYMNFRSWIGLWTTLFLLIMVVTDASCLVKYITRFTEESFAALIGIIFIYEAFNKIIDINKHRPARLQTNQFLPSNCSCTMWNGTRLNQANMTISSCFKNQAYQFSNPSCRPLYDKAYVPDVFFFSIILFASTFTLAYSLKNFKFSRFFPMTIRSKISDFGVVLAIFANVMIDFCVGLDTPKLIVPKTFSPTKEGRGWIINPFAKNTTGWWFAAIIPALLATILIFMDQQITAVIVNRRENKLKKGLGYHLDLLIVTICIGINSILGLPWFVAATVLSINHVISLKLESETAAPGEKAKFLGVREQRVTGFLVFAFIGLSVFLTKFLGVIPMPVLYGVFLYMGISSMKEIQLISRIFLIFMPEKYQPDYVYLRYVQTSRVHLFTIMQITCLILLWVIKSIKSISILFPIMVVALVGARKLMDYIFTQRELGYLDDIMPEIVKKEIEERRNSAMPDNSTNENMKSNKDESQMPGRINFSEEVDKTSIWKSITKDKPDVQEKTSRSSGLKNRFRKFSLTFRGSDEDRVLMNTGQPPAPAIVIDRTERSVSNERDEGR